MRGYAKVILFLLIGLLNCPRGRCEQNDGHYQPTEGLRGAASEIGRTANPSDQTAHQEQGKSQEHSVSISHLPAKDSFDKFALLVNGGLLFTGLIGVGIGMATLKSISVASKRQLRAYIGVTIGDAMYQERDKGFRFGVLPILTNSGQTPGHKVRLLTKCAILPFPLPPSQKLSEIGENEGETTVGINQPLILHARTEDFIHDDDVDGVKAGDRSQALYVWGIIHYSDVFGDFHYSRFCHRMKWIGEGKVYGYYEPNRNDAD